MGIGDHGILAVGKGRTNVAKDTVAADSIVFVEEMLGEI